MRAMSFLLLILGLTAACACAEDLWLGPTMPVKPLSDGRPAPLVPRTQGDTVEDPFDVTGIPFTAAGSTCAFNHDYDRACPYAGSTAPDVVYRYVCEASVEVMIDLCASTYDTKVYVFEDTVGSVIVCSDDYCAFQSHLSAVPFAGGHTYYIVVDGYGTSCGDYELAVDEQWECELVCPPGAMPEGEPDCHYAYSDNYNSGCSCHPFPLFQEIGPSVDPIVICGASGVFMFGSLTYRDMDWFEIGLLEPSQVCLSGDAEIPMYYFICDGRFGCEGFYIAAYAVAGPCSPMADLCHFCGAGTWWLAAMPNNWDLSFECGSRYWMEITGYTPPAATVPEEGLSWGTTWGGIKGLFR